MPFAIGRKRQIEESKNEEGPGRQVQNFMRTQMVEGGQHRGNGIIKGVDTRKKGHKHYKSLGQKGTASAGKGF